MIIKIPVFLSLILLVSPAVANDEHGKFEGSVRLEVIDRSTNNRPMFMLLEDFSFEDSSGKKWEVPKGYEELDGASIPKGFWSLVGGPLSGFYLKASIIHDYYCDVKTESDKDTHRVFYRAMLASGVSQSKSSLMYVAVKAFGPKWELSEERRLCLSEAIECASVPPADNIEEARDFSEFDTVRKARLEGQLTFEVENLMEVARDDEDEYLEQLDDIASRLEEKESALIEPTD